MEVKTRLVEQKYFVAFDGKEFGSMRECQEYEDHLKRIKEGTRIICPSCGGKGGFQGKWIEPYEHWDGPMGGYYEWTTCKKCGGKGYLDKHEEWR